MPKKGVGPQIDEEAYRFYETLFPNTNQGVTFTLEAFPILVRKTLVYELKGKFSKGELQLMLDVMNGCLLTPGLICQHLVANLEDGIKLNQLDQKWKVNADDFLAGIKRLTLFQLAALELWAKGYWDGGHHEEKQKEAAWLKALLNNG